MSSMKQKVEKPTPKSKPKASVRSKKIPAARAKKEPVESTDASPATLVSNGVTKNEHENEIVAQSNKQTRKAVAKTAKEPKSSVPEQVSNRKRKPADSVESAEPAKQTEVPEKKSKVDAKTRTKQRTESKAAAKKKKVLLSVPKLPSICGRLFVLGTNEDGQLGLDLSECIERKRPFELNFPHDLVDIAAGSLHSVCLTDKGEVYTFGCNHEGALGRITEEEGSECIPGKVDIPEVVVRVSAGDSHSAALTESGCVYIWGNFRSEAGEGHIGLIEPNKKETAPVKILNDVRIVDIASGSNHLVCLSEEGIVYTCGSGDHGQLGRVTERSCQGSTRGGLAKLLQPDVVPLKSKSSQVVVENIWAGAYSNFMKAQGSGDIYGFGLNNYQQLGFKGPKNALKCFRPKQIESFAPELQWKQIHCGEHHTLALDGRGKVYSLGREDYGRLGLGEGCTTTGKPTVIPTLQDKECIEIGCGERCSFSVTKEGALYSWGMGSLHQLGHGSDEDCDIPKCVERLLANSWSVFRVSGGGQHTLILANRKKELEEKTSSKDQ